MAATLPELAPAEILSNERLRQALAVRDSLLGRDVNFAVLPAAWFATNSALDAEE